MKHNAWETVQRLVNELDVEVIPVSPSPDDGSCCAQDDTECFDLVPHGALTALAHLTIRLL